MAIKKLNRETYEQARGYVDDQGSRWKAQTEPLGCKRADLVAGDGAKRPSDGDEDIPLQLETPMRPLSDLPPTAELNSSFEGRN